jgi:hypothetical protein
LISPLLVPIEVISYFARIFSLMKKNISILILIMFLLTVVIISLQGVQLKYFLKLASVFIILIGILFVVLILIYNCILGLFNFFF